MRRVLIGMSQEKLGEALGLTFQQVQKYEKGTNRIGASRLQQISKSLNVPPAFFFDGAPTFNPPGLEDSANSALQDETRSSSILDFLATADGLHLNRAFVRIADPKVRKRIIDLVVSLAGEDVADEPDTLA